MSVPQSREGPRKVETGIKYSEGMSSRPVTNNDYEELPDPTSSQETLSTQGSALKVNSHQHQAPNQVKALVNVETLGDGVYNEQEAHESFLEALNAWRNAGKPKEEQK